MNDLRLGLNFTRMTRPMTCLLKRLDSCLKLDQRWLETWLVHFSNDLSRLDTDLCQIQIRDSFYTSWPKNTEHVLQIRLSALRVHERPQLQECEAAWWGLSHGVKVCPCLSFLKVSVCVNKCVCVCVCLHLRPCVCVCVCVCGLSDWEGLTERASQSASIFLSKWRLSLRRLRLISCWLTARPDCKVFPPGLHTHTHAHTRTHTRTPDTPQALTQSPQQLPHQGEREKWKRDKRRKTFEDAVITEGWTESMQCVCVCVCVCVSLCVLAGRRPRLLAW